MSSIFERIMAAMISIMNAFCGKSASSASEAPVPELPDVPVGAELESPDVSVEVESASLDGPAPATPDISQPLLCSRVGMASERGPRPTNDDFCAISWESDFFAVSDGIGGAPWGDVMSRIACAAAVEAYDACGDLGEAFAYANEQVSRVSRWLGERSGATLLLAELADSAMRFAYAGDTVAFRLRGSAFESVMAPGRAVGGGNALDNAVGYGATEPSRAEIAAEPGDRFLLCTDGVWEAVPKTELARLLACGDNAPMIADSICRRAAETGGDNGTCVCVIVGEGAPARLTAPVGIAKTPVVAPIAKEQIV